MKIRLNQRASLNGPNEMEKGNGFVASFGFELLTYEGLIVPSNSKQPV